MKLCLAVLALVPGVALAGDIVVFAASSLKPALDPVAAEWTQATGNVAQLQEELTGTENKIGFSRQLYNDTATQYNTAQQTFPTMLFAGMAGASPATLWEITDEVERAVPQVDLSLGAPPK